LSKENFRVIARNFGECFILGDEILWSNSWNKPNGHKKEQTNRPNKVPINKKNPVIKNGTFPLANVFCNAPSGHEETAPGHE
jgi:hypothetical protein